MNTNLTDKQTEDARNFGSILAKMLAAHSGKDDAVTSIVSAALEQLDKDQALAVLTEALTNIAIFELEDAIEASTCFQYRWGKQSEYMEMVHAEITE